MTAVPHPEAEPATASAPRRAIGDTVARRATGETVALLGAIGPPKGSATLLAIARRARLSYPGFQFRVIGHTDIDPLLREVGNVRITGAYEPRELAGLLDRSEARIALFLHNWPETYSYTLGEAVAHGLYPLVPDLGAPAQRVREAGWGAVFGFPIEVNEVLAAISTALARPVDEQDGVGPTRFAHADAAAKHRALMGVGEQAPTRVA
ncbi:MAG: hypothetical protein ABI224_04695 [Acetobacteraceae bacterium]